MTEPIGNKRFASTINHAIELANNGELDSAVQLLRPLVQDFPEAASVHGYLAWYLSELGQHAEATDHSEHAVNLAPNSHKASLMRFHVLRRSAKYIEAAEEMTRFLLAHPTAEYLELPKKWDVSDPRVSPDANGAR
jgi:predicted Zn-dependent protease